MQKGRRSWLRLGALLVLAVTLVVVAKTTGVASLLTVDKLRELATAAGATGALLFLGAFAAGNLLHVPGMPFVFAGVIAWGAGTGSALALGGAVLAVTLTFVVVRVIGGQPLAAVERPLLRKLLGTLERRPITTIVALRALFQTSPPLNYALAMSPVRFRDYLIGSIVGLALPVLAVTAFLEMAA